MCNSLLKWPIHMLTMYYTRSCKSSCDKCRKEGRRQIRTDSVQRLKRPPDFFYPVRTDLLQSDQMKELLTTQERRESLLWFLFSELQELKWAEVPRNRFVFSITEINSRCETSPFPSLSASAIMSSISACDRSSSAGFLVFTIILWYTYNTYWKDLLREHTSSSGVS